MYLWSVWIEGEGGGVEQSRVDLVQNQFIFSLHYSTPLHSPSFPPPSKQAIKFLPQPWKAALIRDLATRRRYMWPVSSTWQVVWMRMQTCISQPHEILGGNKVANCTIFALCTLDCTCPMHICQHTHTHTLSCEVWKMIQIRVIQILESIEEKFKRSLSQYTKRKSHFFLEKNQSNLSFPSPSLYRLRYSKHLPHP